MRVYTSRLLARINRWCCTAAATPRSRSPRRTSSARTRTILYVKGSGWDLETIEAAGLRAGAGSSICASWRSCPRCPTRRWSTSWRRHLTGAAAPAPSVEAILHAILPYKYVDHTHADAVLADHQHARRRGADPRDLRRRVVVIPYVMPGFDLARLCAERLPAEAGAEHHRHGADEPRHLLVRRHARESYERMIDLVSARRGLLAAQRRLGRRTAGSPQPAAPARRARWTLAGCAGELRRRPGSR